MQYEVSCGAVVFTRRDEEVFYVIIQSRRGHYDFPKGHVEPGETELETAAREVREETGLEITLDPNSRFEFSYDIKDLNVHKTVVLFLATPNTQDIERQEQEIKELKWVPFADVEATLTYDDWKAIWRQARRQLETRQQSDARQSLATGQEPKDHD